MRFDQAMDDAALIDAHLDGDSQAMGALMDRHRGPLMGFLAARVGNEAEDLFQETWSRVARGIDNYSEQGTFRAWVFQIARRQVIDHHRRANARVRLVSIERDDARIIEPVDRARPDLEVETRQISSALQTTLDALPPTLAEVVRLRLIDGVPFKDIALHQGVPLNTALGRMHRGLKTIRQTLIEQGLLTEDRH